MSREYGEMNYGISMGVAMTNIVSTLWEEAVMDGDQIRVGIFSSFARILVDGFDIHVHGQFNGCVDEVISAYKRQEEETEKAFRNSPDEPVEQTVCDDNCGLFEITDEELDELVREYEKGRGQVISMKMKTKKTI